MLAVEVKQKFKLALNRAELEVLIQMLAWYLGSLPVAPSIPELANAQRVMKLGQKVQHKLYTHTGAGSCKLTLNVQEASSLLMVIEALRGVQLGTLEVVVVYKLNDALRI